MVHNIQSKRILIIGSGAVGTTIAHWLAPHHKELFILDQGETLNEIRKNGVTAYLQHQQAEAKPHSVNTIESLSELDAPDYIFLCVKNYSLAVISKLILEHYGTSPIIVACQNGAENQEIMPRFFPKVIYGVVCYNAWIDSPGVVGYQQKGPLALGTLDNSLTEELEELKSIMNPGVPIIITDHLRDAVVSKIIINLTNSLTTLVGIGFNPVDNESLFQKMLSTLVFEGTQIAAAAGFKECKMGGMPSWLMIRLSASLPQILTRRTFRKNAAKMVVSSMAQDVIANKQGNNELDGINGYMLALADEHQIEAPFNRAIYAICKEEFSNENFQPLNVSQAWERINQYIDAASLEHTGQPNKAQL